MVQGSKARLHPEAGRGPSCSPERATASALRKRPHASHSALTFVSGSWVVMSLSPRCLSSTVPAPPAPPSPLLRGDGETECSVWARRDVFHQVPSDRGVSGVVTRLTWTRVSASRWAVPSASLASGGLLPDLRPAVPGQTDRTGALPLEFALCLLWLSPALALCASPLSCPCAAHFPTVVFLVFLLICKSSSTSKEASPAFFRLAGFFCCHSDLSMVFFCIKRGLNIFFGTIYSAHSNMIFIYVGSCKFKIMKL